MHNKPWPIEAWRENFTRAIHANRKRYRLQKAFLLACLSILLTGFVLTSIKEPLKQDKVENSILIEQQSENRSDKGNVAVNITLPINSSTEKKVEKIPEDKVISLLNCNSKLN